MKETTRTGEALAIYVSILHSVSEVLDTDHDLKMDVCQGMSLAVRMIYEDLEMLSSKLYFLDVPVAKN